MFENSYFITIIYIFWAKNSASKWLFLIMGFNKFVLTNMEHTSINFFLENYSLKSSNLT